MKLQSQLIHNMVKSSPAPSIASDNMLLVNDCCYNVGTSFSQYVFAQNSHHTSLSKSNPDTAPVASSI